LQREGWNSRNDGDQSAQEIWCRFRKQAGIKVENRSVAGRLLGGRGELNGFHPPLDQRFSAKNKLL
jgi:hypothetical protein